jgi:ankyrin repeat protein
MKTLPASPNLSHLKKQAKHLLRDARSGQSPALQRFLDVLPAARGLDLATLTPGPLRLHDAQSVVAREYGFISWTELKRYVAWTRSATADRLRVWSTWALEGNARDRGLAVRMLREEPALFADDAWLACVAGDEVAVRKALASEPDFANRRGGAFFMPPLAAVTHSRLILEEGFEAGLLACANLLLKQGADVNGSWSDPRWPGNPLSVLYGAAGRTHHAGMTKLLLEAGANPDDNESLYHSVEGPDSSCTQLLLDAGARVSGTNAIGRVLDYDKLAALRLLLKHGGDAVEGTRIHHAILRGRSLAHIQALAEAGADLRATNDDGVSVYRWARMHGRVDVVEMLQDAGVEEPITEEEAFVAACARGDESAARSIRDRIPDVFSRLRDWQLQSMPQRAGVGDLRAVRTMLALGWPREVKSGWEATALNHAVFQGDSQMARLLLEHGACWQTQHGFGDNVLGTLSFASRAEDIGDPAPRDYVGCAAALVDHGVPISAFQCYGFSADVTDYLESEWLDRADPE